MTSPSGVATRNKASGEISLSSDMDYIAVIDYDHLDNPLFLTAFARSLSRQKEGRGLILHGDSLYVERLLQIGVMREDAVVRATRDLNRRLIALFADHGVAAIGLNACQRSMVRLTPSGPVVDTRQLLGFPPQPHLLLSNLVESEGRPVPLPLGDFARLLGEALEIGDLFVFSLDDSDEVMVKDLPDVVGWEQVGKLLPEEKIPREFREASFPLRLATARSFAGWPSLEGSILISSAPGKST